MKFKTIEEFLENIQMRRMVVYDPQKDFLPAFETIIMTEEERNALVDLIRLYRQDPASEFEIWLLSRLK